MIGEVIAAVIAGLGIGGGAGYAASQMRLKASRQTGEDIIRQAEKEAENVKKAQELAGKEELLRRRQELDREFNQSREELRDTERRLDKREAGLEEQHQDIVKKERLLETQQSKLAEKTKAIEVREKEAEKAVRQQQEELFRISGLSPDAARQTLLTRIEKDLKGEIGTIILRHQNEVKAECDRLSREIIGMAIQRYASAHTSETTVSSVDIPNDEMKGRIIGPEGRNIRAFEKATGVDVIVDDTPGVVIVSAFDPVRREIARMALSKLIQDGRIHPTRIEEVVNETQKEIESHIRRMGQEACDEAGVLGLHERLIELMGRLEFRISYSQNVRRHSIEVAHLTGLMAEQLGLDGRLARRCGFLHDIGKAADHEMEGGHPAVGAELLKRFHEGPEVVHAAAGHHDDIRVDYIYTVLVAAADAISAARPGARRQTLEKYVRRLEELEALASGFPGVEHSYAVQAGREIRVIVDSRQINDREAAKLAKDIATAIEQTLTYPGEIKVTILRELRFVEVAK